MKRKLLLAILIVAGGFMGAQAQVEVKRPKLVVGIIIDQMRWDYSYTYDFSAGGGFSRLMGEGYSCQNCIIDYLPTVTAVGHASVWTGTTPAVHGIAGNNFFINDYNTTSTQDTTVVGVGTPHKAGKQSPRNLLSTTIGDELKAATKFKSKVIGIALKDRAAILPAGHSANAAYWYDAKVPGFITSTYYMKELPSWVSDFNQRHITADMGNPTKSYRGVTLTFDMAKAALENEKLGKGETTDLLAVSISPTDLVSHYYGTHSPQLDSCYYEVDRQLASFFDALDRQVGKGNYLLFFTADHAGTNSYIYNTAHRLPSGGWNYWSENNTYNKELKARFGVDKLVKGVHEFSIYLNNDSIKKYGINRDEVAQAVKDYFEADHRVDRVVDYAHFDREVLTSELRERLAKGYHPKRTGELFVVLKPGRYCSSESSPGSTHGTWSMDDSHIPCVFMGWGITPGETAQQVGQIDIAATICAMLHIQMPTGCLGKPITSVVK